MVLRLGVPGGLAKNSGSLATFQTSSVSGCGVGTSNGLLKFPSEAATRSIVYTVSQSFYILTLRKYCFPDDTKMLLPLWRGLAVTNL